MAHDEEAGGVDAVGQLFQPGQFPVGHDAQQHRAGFAGVAALAVEDGHAAVQLGEDGGTDGVGLAADDLHFGAAGTQHQHLVHDDGVDEHHHDAVEHLLHRAEHGLHQQHRDVEGQHGGRHRQLEPLVEHQRRDVEAAGGCAGADDEAQRHADAEARKDSAEEDVLRQHPACQQPFKEAEKGWAEDAAGQCVEGKGPAKDRPAPDQHSKVNEEQQPRDGQPRQPPDGQRDASGTAGDEARRLEEEGHRQRVERIAEEDGGPVPGQLFPVRILNHIICLPYHSFYHTGNRQKNPRPAACRGVDFCSSDR